jgi:tRNA-dihydrouridine synthase B
MDRVPQLSHSFRPFLIGDVQVNNPFILAPMDGISDSPFRLITRELGSAVSYTEFVNTMDVVSHGVSYEKRCFFSEAERPVVFQLFDDDPARMIKASLKLYQRWKPDIIDVNMGCSVRHVVNRGAGAELLRHPNKIIEIIDGLVKVHSIPITIKIRLGWDELSKNYLEVGRIAQDYGASAITLHARTKEQNFMDPIDLESIASLKQSLQIPVIGNGNIQSIKDADQMFEYTECDAVMIGRAAIWNPWIFSGFDENEVPYSLFLETVKKHLETMKQFHGPEKGCIVFRKFAKKYLQKFSIPAEKIVEIITTEDPVQFTTTFFHLIENKNLYVRSIMKHDDDE